MTRREERARASRPVPPRSVDRRGVDARGAQVGSIGDHNTVVVTFVGAVRRAEWRVWFVAPVAAAAAAAWLIAAATVVGPTTSWLAAGATAVAVLVGLTIWQTVRTRREQRAADRRARGEALESLELPRLPAGVQSVATLIAAEQAVAPLEGRGREVGELVSWCQDPHAPVVRILEGPSGVGKTRLSVEVGRALPQGWVAGRCVPGRAVDVLGLVRACREPTLIVLDDADTHPDIPRLIEQLTVTPPAGPQVKVLLVVRNAPGFTQSLRQDLRGAAAADWPVTTVVVEGGVGDRRRWFARAVTAYAEATGRSVLAGLVGDMRPVGEPNEPMIITQVRAALTVLTDGAQDADRFRTASLGELATAVVVRERHRWHKVADDPRWKLPKRLTNQGRDEAMLALVALAPTTTDESVAALRRLPRLAEMKTDRLINTAEWAHHVYPGPTSGGAWVDPAPDYVLGALLAHLATEHSALAAALDLGATAQQRPAVMLRLVRATAHFPSITSLTNTVLDQAPQLVPGMVEYALVSGATDRATRVVLVTVVTDHMVPAAEASRLLDLIMGPEWNRLRVALQRSLVHSARAALASADTDETGDDLAGSLSDLGGGLRAVGEHREALTAFREAVALYRRLAESEPARYTGDLAGSLNNLGGDLWAVGEHREALTAFREAVALYRKVAESEPARYTGDLAGSLSNLGGGLRAVGEHREALTAFREAVALRRKLAESEPARYTGDLAGFLNNLGLGLREVGEHREALTAFREAVALHRKLAESEPARYTGDLAHSLNNLGGDLWAVGEHREALTASREAVALRRKLAESEPARYTGDLAQSLSNLGVGLWAVGEHREALTAFREAVALYRKVAESEPARYTGDLAGSLNNLGLGLRAVGEHREALTASREAVALYRKLAESEPARYTGDLAGSLNTLGAGLWAVGEHREALTASREAVALYRKLAESEPARYTGDLAHSLNNLGGGLWAVGEHREALTASREAVALRRKLAESEPARYTGDLAHSLNNLADNLLAVEHLAEALACRGEAVARWRYLAYRRPNDFEDEYRREQGQLARFCSEHNFPPAEAIKVENDAVRRLGLDQGVSQHAAVVGPAAGHDDRDRAGGRGSESAP